MCNITPLEVELDELENCPVIDEGSARCISSFSGFLACYVSVIPICREFSF